ncbi:hypothetical protein [Polaribacter porphyrae]|uniref:Adhesin domain-containing protein n=1 Tax=Polaribacter porphyrae TaxID=1137780 RepID=A0A2S7WJX7_9FLAO|nr:hypothetical protein [Polaribacter porphyrae]PQJ77917.1 hypothetical protein BTO18_01380 [Polaribacter porphyrae]
MKTLKHIVVFALTITFLNVNGQEKKIKFSKGTLKICSSKNFQIEGYDGNEVIIKSLHEKRGENSTFVVSGTSNQNAYSIASNNGLARVGRVSQSTRKNDSSRFRTLVYPGNDISRKKGLKKLGAKNQNADLGIYFTIEQKDGELLFKDQSRAGFIMSSNENYLLKIPNTLKLVWRTSKCDSKNSSNQYRFFSSKSSTLSNFDGEVEIASNLNNTKLKDVTGPVVINTIGGNVTVEFEKKYPKALYSIYTNNGFIDIQIPEKSNLLVDVIGKSVYSDVDFKVLEEEEVDDVWQKTTKMKLKYGTGKIKMKLNGGFGNVYLRKK